MDFISDDSGLLVVVGGGPAGAVAAATLARRGLPVLLLAGESRPGAFAGGESLPPLAPVLRDELGLGAVLAAGPHLPCYGNAAAWGRPELAYRSFIHSPYGTGWHLDRPSFDAALRERAKAAGAQVIAGQLRTVGTDPAGGWLLHIAGAAGEQEIRAAWVLDCTGRRRMVSRQLGIGYDHADSLVAHYVSYQAAGPPDAERLTLVAAGPMGWGHSAGLPGDKRIITLFTDANDPATRALSTEAGFAAAVAELPQLQGFLLTHGYAPLGPPRVTDSRSGCLRQLHGPGWLAVGDAATAFDPLAAQGILAAVAGGHRAALALIAALAGDSQALPTYAWHVCGRYEQLQMAARQQYAQEQRWAAAPFWQSRHTKTVNSRVNNGKFSI